MRRGIGAVLHSRRNWKVVGEAANGREAVEKAVGLQPDVAIVDLSMPDLHGIEVVKQIREAVPATKILVLTMHDSAQMVRRSLDAGALGYVLKSDLTESIPEAVKAIAEGKRSVTPKVSEIIISEFLESRGLQKRSGGSQPTPRETEIIRLLAEGKTNKEIAALLGIAVRTVETHRSKIMLKLDIHSLAELIHYAMRHEITKAPGENRIPGMRP